MILLLAAILTVQVVSIALCVLSVLHARRVMRDYLADFFGGQPSKFNAFCDDLAQVLAAKVVQSAEAVLRGSLGGATKAVNAAEQQALIRQNPVLGIATGLKLGKNPLIKSIIEQFIMSRIPGNNQPVEAGRNGESSPKFRL